MHFKQKISSETIIFLIAKLIQIYKYLSYQSQIQVLSCQMEGQILNTSQNPQSEIQKRAIGDNQLHLFYHPDVLILRYTTMDSFETYQVRISQENYKKLFEEMIPWIKLWSKFVAKIKKKLLNIQLKGQSKLIFFFENKSMDEQEIIKVQLQMEKLKETELQKSKKEIKYLKIQLQEKQKKINQNDQEKAKDIQKIQNDHKKQIEEKQKKINQKDQEKARDIQKIQNDHKKQIEENNKKHQAEIKQLNEGWKRKQQIWNEKSQRIFNQNKQYIPNRKSFLFEQQNNIEKISNIVLPRYFQQRLKQFKKRLEKEPKYIVSVSGVSSAGKSTLLTRIMENNKQMKEVYKKSEEKGERILIFPANKKSSTYYDTFYTYNSQANEPEYSKDLTIEKIISSQIWMDGAEEITFYVDDNIQFKREKDVDLTKIQQEGRQKLKKIESLEEKQQIYEKRNMIVRCKIDIFASKQQKYSFLNRYLVLLDRVGTNDDIYKQFKQKKEEAQKIKQSQLNKIKNQTVLYCMKQYQLRNSDEAAENNLLSLMMTHDFQKIILCVNEHDLLIDGQCYITMKDRLIKLETFFEEIFQLIFSFLCDLISKHVQKLEKSSKNCQTSICLKMKQRAMGKQETKEQKQFFSKDKIIRLQLNRYKDQLQKYQAIKQQFSQFSKVIRKKIIDSQSQNILQQIQQDVHKMIQKYPFKNIHIFGLQNYSQRFPIIKYIEEYTDTQLYKNIGAKSLNSIQRYYEEKSNQLDSYHNQLEQYYTNLPLFLVEFRQKLKVSEEESKLQHLKNMFQNLPKKFKEKIQELNQNINSILSTQSNFENHNNLGKNIWDFFIKHCKKIFEQVNTTYLYFEDYQQYLVKLFQIHHNDFNTLGQGSSLIGYGYGYGFGQYSIQNRLMKQIHEKEKSAWHKRILQNVSILIFDVRQTFVKIYKQVYIKWNKIVKLAQDYMGQFFLKNNFLTLEFSKEIQPLKQFTAYTHEYEKEGQKHLEISVKKQIKNFLNQLDKQIEKYNSIVQINHKTFEILMFLRKDMEKRIEEEKKIVQDAITELKLEYKKHLRIIHYELVLNNVVEKGVNEE